MPRQKQEIAQRLQDDDGILQLVRSRIMNTDAVGDFAADFQRQQNQPLNA